MRWSSTLAILATLIVVVALACGTEIQEPPLKCEAAGNDIVAAIASSLTAQDPSSLRGAQAVKSLHYENAWFIGADIQAPGLEGSRDIGVWATGDNTNLTWLAWVNEVAEEFSDLGGAGEDADKFSLDAANEFVETCVEGALR